MEPVSPTVDYRREQDAGREDHGQTAALMKSDATSKYFAWRPTKGAT